MTTEILANGRTYTHRRAAHCETGVISALFADQGLHLSEPMIFGIGSGIFFGHLPFIKWVGLPITTFRSIPGLVLKRRRRESVPRFTENGFAARSGAWMNCAALSAPDKLWR